MERRRIRLLAARASYRGRATVTFALATAVVSVLLGVLAYSTSRSYLTEQRESAARDRAYLNARVVREQLRSRHDDPGVALSALSTEEGTAALLRAGDTWFSTSVAVGDGDVPDAVLSAVADGVAAWQRHRVPSGPRLAVAVPLPSVDAVYAEIIPLNQLEDALSTMRSSLLVAGLVTSAGGGLLGFLVAGRLVRPLRKLAERAEAIAAGDAVELGSVREAELQPLVGSLNRLLEGFARRVEQESRFVSDVSHEVRAPLAALSAAVEVMQRRRAQLPDRSAHALDVLSEQIDGFQELVLGLLEISKIDAGRAELHLEPSSCSTLVRHAAASIGLADVPVYVDPSVPDQVLLDRRRMGQVILNLLENARRYAGGATELEVTSADGHLLFKVADRGPGVPADQRERIFERFERGDHGPSGPRGTGLGLALVREHASLHGGRVWVDDREGGGAVFVVEVPLCIPS